MNNDKVYILRIWYFNSFILLIRDLQNISIRHYCVFRGRVLRKIEFLPVNPKNIPVVYENKTIVDGGSPRFQEIFLE